MAKTIIMVILMIMGGNKINNEKPQQLWNNNVEVKHYFDNEDPSFDERYVINYENHTYIIFPDNTDKSICIK